MKKEKLELLLNKVVEYNNPDAYDSNGCNFKAFLYKNKRGYYFKVVEVMAGTDLAFDDIIPLNDEDENFLVIADKPKLMRVSRKSWHYKLMKYVLKSNTPTPKDMQNGCPYFWLVMFSMIVVPFILLGKGIYHTFMLIPKTLNWILKQIVNSWVAGLDEEAAYDLLWNGRHSKMPKTAKIFFNNSDNNFFDFFLSKKYGNLEDDPNYEEKREEIRLKWEKWRKEINERRDAERLEENKRRDEYEKKRKEHQKKREESKAKWDARMKPFYDGFAKIGVVLTKTFTVERGRVNLIVKRTKQFVGALVTLIILVGTFFLVTFISRGLMVAADWCIINWIYFAIVGLLGIAVGILYLLWILISSWGQNIVNKYKRGKRVWYIEPVIYLIWYPVKYTAIGIAFLVVYVIWIPVKFILYTLFFKYFLKPIGLFVAKVVVGLVKGIASSSGIFGEYFGASYSDYCPGIEWCDFDEE